MLKDKTIPFEERQKIAHSVLTKYLNLKAQSGRCIVLLCMIDIFSNNGYSSFYILMRNLIKSIKKKISKAMARFIVRKLKEKDINIDPELVLTLNKFEKSPYPVQTGYGLFFN